MARTPRQVLRAFLDAFGDDKASVVELFREDAKVTCEGAPWVPTCGDHIGREAIARYFAWQADVLFTRAMEIHEIVEWGDSAIVIGRFDYWVDRTRRGYAGDFIVRITVVDGLISRYHVYENSWAVAEAFRYYPTTSAAP